MLKKLREVEKNCISEQQIHKFLKFIRLSEYGIISWVNMETHWSPEWIPVRSGAQPVVVTVSSVGPATIIHCDVVSACLDSSSDNTATVRLNVSPVLSESHSRLQTDNVWNWREVWWLRGQVRVGGIPSEGRKPPAWYHHLFTFLSTSPSWFSPAPRPSVETAKVNLSHH